MDWQLRIYRNRKLYDISNEEMAEIFNKELGVRKDESAWRKYLKAFNDGYEYAINNNLDVTEALKELEEKELRIKEETNKLRSLRIDYNRMIREKSRRDLIFEELKDGFERLSVPDIHIVPNDNFSGQRKAVLAFGDAHWGKVFESIHNVYSPEIFEQRMKQLAEETISYLHKEGFDRLDILSMADSIEGMSLRISQLQSLSTGFIDQTIMFAKYMAGWLNEMSKHFNKITYHQIPSANHSEVRPFFTKRGEFPAEDFEKVIINYLHDVLEHNPRIEIPIYKNDIIDFELLGLNHAATHGHAYKKGKNLLKDISFHRRKFYSYLWIAHYHHSEVVTVGEAEDHNLEIITVPSIMGSDEYADSLLTGAKAGAVINIFEEGKGRTDQHNIILN